MCALKADCNTCSCHTAEIPHSALKHCPNCVFPPNWNCSCSCHKSAERKCPCEQAGEKCCGLHEHVSDTAETECICKENLAAKDCPIHWPTDTVEKKCTCGSPEKEGWKHSATMCGGLSSSRPTTDTSDWRKPSWLQKEFQVNYVNAVSLKNLIVKELEKARTEIYDGEYLTPREVGLFEKGLKKGREEGIAQGRIDEAIFCHDHKGGRFEEGVTAERARLWQIVTRIKHPKMKGAANQYGYERALQDILNLLSDSQ